VRPEGTHGQGRVGGIRGRTEPNEIDGCALDGPRGRGVRAAHRGIRPRAFPNAWEFARRRLELLEACHDPGSFRRAAALGVGPGWRCLDAGAGGGSFARWPADVGAELDGQLFPGRSEIAQSWSLTWLRAREGIVARWIAGEVIDRGRAELDDPKLWFHGPVKIAAWGWRR
jgi:hypothetical protein